MIGSFEKALVRPDSSIRGVIRKLNESAVQIALVADEGNRLLGVVTDGDVRRAILAEMSMDTSVQKIMNHDPICITEQERPRAVSIMKKEVITAIPVVDDGHRIVDLILWRDVNEGDHHGSFRTKTNTVFIQAGGKGSRLRPFTNVLPKPLIPIGDVPIVEIIMKRFQHYGYENFILGLNYKAEMIRAYFADQSHGYKLGYVQESSYMGTAGCLSLLNGAVSDTILMSNCDVLLDIDLDDFLAHHKENGNDATIVSVFRHVRIPYGVLEIREGRLMDIKEKPEFDFVVNAGIYAIEPSVLPMIGTDEYLDIPDLLLKMRDQGMGVGVYPVARNLIDVGQWEEYDRAVDRMKHFGISGI